LSYHHPSQVVAFHSCDKKIGLKILNGEEDLIASENAWDWLGTGIYFWEFNPERALEYAKESATGKQFNKIKIETPFVLGANILLGNCFNLLDSRAIENLHEAYNYLQILYEISDIEMPKNKKTIRKLDCAVIKAVHEINKLQNRNPFDTVRCAFVEGNEIYPTSNFTDRLHIEISVINPQMIQGYFLPKPIELYNPYLK
jgi:hypothetical protein